MNGAAQWWPAGVKKLCGHDKCCSLGFELTLIELDKLCNIWSNEGHLFRMLRIFIILKISANNDKHMKQWYSETVWDC